MKSGDLEGQIIRIYHECDGGIEKPVPRITVWNHKACQEMTKGKVEGRIFLSHPHTQDRYISCSPLNITFIYLTRQIRQIYIPRRRVISEKHVNHKT